MRRTLSTAAVALALAVAVAAQARPPRCPAAASDYDCTPNRHEDTSDEFTVQGNYFKIKYVDGKNLWLLCGARGPSLESRALPRFETRLLVEQVTVKQCAGAPYAAALRRLNVSLAPRADLAVYGARAFRAAHLAGLPGLRALTLHGAGAPAGPLLALLPALVNVSVSSTRLPAGELDAPPRTLERIHLMNAGVSRVPAAVLALPALRALTVLGEEEVRVERAPGADGNALRTLQVSNAEASLLTEWAPPALEVAYLVSWRARSPTPVPACAALTTLTLIEPLVVRLPDAWVARCGHLATLEVRSARHLTRLPARLLANASSLEVFALTESALSSLPADLFADTPLLARLDLSGNRLTELPSGLLAPAAAALRELDLARNALSARAGAALGALRGLRRLSLARNPLRDLCRPEADAYVTVIKDKSPLASLSKLEILNLRNTNVTVICSDWRTDLPLLAELDLHGTLVASLTAEDLNYTRGVPGAVVKLTGTPLRDVRLTAADYDALVAARAGAGAGAPTATVTLGGRGTSLVCDCFLYWVARALAEDLLPLGPESELRCAGGGTLRDADPDELACVAPPGACPAPLPRGCACAAAGGLRSGRAVLRLRCEGAALPRVPRLPAPLPADVGAVDLLLFNNSIAEIALDDIPPLLRNFDLRNNSIERIEEATAAALVGRGAGDAAGARRVRLAGNPLDCSCRLAGARRVLRAAAARLPGYGEAVRCASGRPLAEVSEAECAAPAPALVASLVGLAAGAALAVGALAVRCGALRRLKALLRRAGWGPAAEAGAGAAAHPYDVFVTFGRGDEAAALEVTARLEGGARRVLLQERDWLPPAWVPHCLAASVAAARHTVALASPAWERALASAEVRAAFEPAWARGSLLVLLPPSPAPAPAAGAGDALADPALRRYARDYPHLVLRRDPRTLGPALDRALPPPPPPRAHLLETKLDRQSTQVKF